ncbi:UrcA family protein [Brevundimonas sp. Root1279]|uniref:UrcA family protein n=1 Tax=Brevundimonas sp. Root1279 TaxID=1736443 RepID=UPI000A3DBB3A|nr:UrcA family protein [Brevundimonas sp. Root1279]
MKTTLMMFTLAAVALSAPMLASAQGQDTLPSIQVTPRQMVVSYADLDTKTDWGMRLLDRRLNTATAQVCRFYDNRLEDVQVENRCRRGAKVDAMAQFRANETRRIDQASARSPETASVTVTSH